MSDQLKILIVRLSAIGDVVQTLPIVHALRRKFNNAQISWIVEDKSAEILLNNSAIDKVYILPKQKWKKKGFSTENLKEFSEIIKDIRKEKFDIAIDVQGLFKSGLITYLSGAKRRIGHAGTREFADIFLNEKLKAHDIFDPNKLIIERYLEPAGYLGAPVDEVKFSMPEIDKNICNYADQLLIDIDTIKPIIIFSPATIWKTKHWIEEYWTELLLMLCDENNIIFTGSKNDIALIERITKNVSKDKFISLAGKTTLLELLALFKRSDIVVAPDTGPLHIANATDKPVIISIFGSTSYKRTPPYGSKHIALSTNLPCQPCFSRKCLNQNNQMECMKKITPEQVLNSIKQKL